MKLAVTRKFKWSMAHRLVDGYVGKCSNLHGHSYVLDVTVESVDSKLDDFGMVADFAAVKSIVSTVLEPLDHATVCCVRDLVLKEFLERTDQKRVITSGNTTAENLIDWLMFRINTEFRRSGSYLKAAHARLWETDDCSVEWRSE